MAQAATRAMLKLTVLGLAVLSAQGNGQYFRRLRFRDYEVKSDPVPVMGLRGVDLPGTRSRTMDNGVASREVNLRNPVSRAFLVRGSTSNPLVGTMPLFPNFIQTFVTQDTDGEYEQTNLFSGANPFASLFSIPKMIVISSVDGSKVPADGGVNQGEPSPAPENSPPARGNYLDARSVLPSDGIRNFRFEDLFGYEDAIV